MQGATTFHIEVAAEGVPLELATEMFSCARHTVRLFMQRDALGTPRDYEMRAGRLWITPAGLRELAACLGHDAVVVVKGKLSPQ